MVVSQEKVYEATSPPSHFGNVQRQLNQPNSLNSLQSLQVSESVRQGSSCNSSFNHLNNSFSNASKVI